MLTVDVTPQVNFALKRPVLTDMTSERLEAGVFATVGDEVRRLAERLTTLATRVRLLAFINQSHTHSHTHHADHHSLFGAFSNARRRHM